ncbi:glutamate ABC transporter substrate-binding protein [Saccharomonospora cyanea]|uniref:Periplasmic component of amino acid ABC-type transporter/signal transduction system n=1 Tax=Saccharomonospora cyanea NA-134 TaxID=882082 RepID=H5XKI4_9PSEU|nr:glutamate ABC transporter substrate-binding protein [Saccharomonospora cyanea]EHR59817.1 periplasmic component of amino acid ABC-type transporter/signal transduction system [Saccharomonospora cyanea NA-134]
MRRLRCLVNVALAGILLAACSATTAEPGSIVARASDTESLTIGIRFDQPGLSERTIDGRLVGFDADVARFVAAELGVAEENIVWRETIPSAREDALRSGAVDLVVAAYSITDERSREVTFAGPYFETGQGLLVRRTSADPADISGPDSLAGRTVCTSTGSTSAHNVKQRFGDSVKLAEYPRVSECVTALIAGRVDAVTTDGAILAGYVAQHPELMTLAGDRWSTESYGIGLRKGDLDGQAAVNAALRKMIDSGSWRASLERHLAPSGVEVSDPPEIEGP